jgi:hypothetical protein
MNKMNITVTIKYFAAFIILILLVSKCATSNYYTAQTLKKGEKALSPGFDNLFLYDMKDKDNTFGFSPSFGYIHGLPHRFETGLRYYFPFVLEGMVRNQLNPPSFKTFDISINLHVGIRYYFDDDGVNIFDEYIKPGLTISKEICEYQPFISYYRMYPEYSIGDEETTKTYMNSVFAFGLAIPYKNDFIIPEINYQCRISNLSEGAFFIGIGIRTFINKKK